MIIDTTKIKDFIKKEKANLVIVRNALHVKEFPTIFKEKDFKNALVNVTEKLLRFELMYDKLSDIEDFIITFDLQRKKK